MEGLEQISFQIISATGTAKSCFMEAIQCAKKNDFAGAKEKIAEGDAQMNEGHKIHFGLVQKEANGEHVDFQLLLMHAEDQMMAAETIRILALELIDLYQR